MKNPRDILVAGMGFLLGMVVCYFLIASASVKMANIAMNQSQPTPILARVAGAPGDLESQQRRAKTWIEGVLMPRADEKPFRIEPKYRFEERGTFEILPMKPTLIDFDYVPDFKIDFPL